MDHVLLQRRSVHRLRFKLAQLWLRAHRLSVTKDTEHVMWLFSQESEMVEREAVL